MNGVNNWIMKKLIPLYNQKGIYFCNKQVLKFQAMSDIISEEDIFSLFSGFIRLIKRSAELEVEKKFIKKINHLELELSELKSRQDIK